MKNVYYYARLLRGFYMALFVLAATLTSANAESGVSVSNPEGQVIGVLVEPLRSNAKVAPTVMIRLHDGSVQATNASALTRNNQGYVLNHAETPASETDAAKDAAFEVRSMTMAMIMQSHEDVKLLSQISDMTYSVNDNKLYLAGSLSSTRDLERLLNVTADLCEFEIVPNIKIGA
ncbi:hypothetical protein [Cerasicoccus fimbriatus]|uniref:hypothetical protein n=1 Tax=Cerasicoccus fimbriatus TaxID=3014554 RepID=UPI0022B4B704|nr:hypothetical protein [Cerasicoccus sp. TK19100]